ncbi:MAG: hypothetical protein ACRDJ1_05445 [Actinomycetota bacterium]
MSRLARAVALLAGLFFLGLGVWAFFDPRSFYEQLATFPPYNRHLFHDAGAFQIGIGATLLLALTWKDGLSIALGGASVLAVMHAISHFIDKDLGGKDTDPWFLSFVAAVIVIGFIARRRTGGA